MKKGIFLVLIAFGLFSCNNNSKKEAMEIGQWTTVSVQKVYDAGTVAKGELIHHKFKIVNTGSYPLILAEVEPSCTCTVSEFEKKPIPPGKSTIIEATVDTDKTGLGKINKPINVTANTHPSTTTLTIKANVIK